MRANELMIDDWVKSLKEDHSGEYGQVIDIDHHDTVLLEYQCVNYYTDVEHIEPIPITPEILTANGFEKKENHSGCHYANYIDHSPVYAEQTIGDQWEIDIYQNGKIEMCVRYVHELQHILRLQGLTDFADQFKVKGGQP